MSPMSVAETGPALPRGLSSEDLTGHLYLGPAGIVAGTVSALAALPLAGGPLAFADCRLWWRHDGAVREWLLPLPELRAWNAAEGAAAPVVETLLQRLVRPRAAFAGLSLDRPRLMGVLNVTPDSFSDGGRFFGPDAAIAQGQALLAVGADILDIGGESTRPGAEAVEPAEEMRRILPVIRALAEKGAVISVDTRHAAVMGAAVEAGAAIINDITALTGDAAALGVAAASGASILLMHMQGEPASMQHEPRYDCAPLDVYDILAARLAACQSAGIPLDKLCVDPGIGFGKTLDHNLQILARLALYHGLGVPICLGVSRKSFIAKLLPGTSTEHRLAGSLAAALVGLQQGVQLLRVHDVAETAQAVTVWRAASAGQI